MSEKGLQRRIARHIKAEEHCFYVVCKPGFEPVVAAELEGLGISGVEVLGQGGLEFTGSIEDCYLVNLASRYATRVLLRIVSFKAIYFEKLAAKLAEIPWELYLKKNVPLAFSVTCRHSRLYHSGRIEAEAIRAINERLDSVEHFSGSSYLFPHQVFLRLQDDRCTVSLDTSGDPLYMRGYKVHGSRAPLRENLAALLLREAHFEKYQVLLDPMCGSGTIPIEAACINRGMLAGENRPYAFQDWPVFREANFSYIKSSLREKLEKTEPAHPLAIYASDIEREAVEKTAGNVRQAGLDKVITVAHADFFSLKRSDFPEGNMLILSNLPYGKRIGAAKDIVLFYQRIAEKLSSDFPSEAYALLLPAEVLKNVPALRYTGKKYFINGGIKVVLLIKE